MHVFFEDDGHLKAGTVLADNDASLQVEAVSGKRLKIKAAAVLLRFADPAPPELIADAQRLTSELDPNFLWEVCPDEDFGFGELARDYFGRSPAAAESAAVAMTLAAAPMYFYKRGKGRYRKAPPEALKAALASIDRKKREGEQLALWRDELCAHRLRTRCARIADAAVQARQNTLEWKALAAACDAARMSPLALLAECGAIRRRMTTTSTRSSHRRFRRAPRSPRTARWPAPEPGRGRPRFLDRRCDDDRDRRRLLGSRAVERQPEIIHIAAPALAIPRGSPLDAIARARLSTVYMPGRKITMLPEQVVEAFTLAEGRSVPALSLYAEIAPDGRRVGQTTRVERVPIAANLRLDSIGEAFANKQPASDEPPWTEELRALWQFAQGLSSDRGKAEFTRVDYSFYVDLNEAQPNIEAGRVRIVPRPRASPLDKLVSGLMIFVNSSWGKLLADARVAGLYRTQSNGKVKMSTRPGEHQGLGLAHYLWSSSPLRRYSDLVNQRQLLAILEGARPPYRRTTPSSSRPSPISRRRIRPTGSFRTGWSTIGACAGSCRKASPR
jgi:exoribonuclease-2